MKKLIMTLLAIGFVSVTAHAQTPVYAAQTLGTFQQVGSGATNVAYVLDVRKQNTVSIQWDRQSNGAGAQPVVIAFSRSNDGSTYDTTLDTISLASGGATATTTCTNISSYGAGYIKIAYMTNANANTVYTTNTLKYSIKIGAD